MNANAININMSIWGFPGSDPGTAVKGSLLNPQLVAGGPRLPLVGNHVRGLLRVARSQPAALSPLPNFEDSICFQRPIAIWILEQKCTFKMPVSHPDCVLHSVRLILYQSTCPQCESTSHRSQRKSSLSKTSWCQFLYVLSLLMKAHFGFPWWSLG